MDLFEFAIYLQIKALVPCIANLRNLVWFNVNRNPINSLVPGFRRVVGPMATDQECKLAAQRVIAWMAGQLKDHDQLGANDELLFQKLQRRGMKSKMRDLCGASRLVESESERLVVVRPEGCAPFAAQVFNNPLNLGRRSSELKVQAVKSWNRSEGLSLVFDIPSSRSSIFRGLEYRLICVCTVDCINTTRVLANLY